MKSMLQNESDVFQVKAWIQQYCRENGNPQGTVECLFLPKNGRMLFRIFWNVPAHDDFPDFQTYHIWDYGAPLQISIREFCNITGQALVMNMQCAERTYKEGGLER